MESEDSERSKLRLVLEAYRWLGKDTLSASAIGFSLFLLGIVLVSGLARSALSPGAIEQPVAFNHQIHVEELGLECTECHPYYEKEAFSGLPTAETCAFCHEEAQGENPEEMKLVRLLSEGRELEWKQLYRQPPHVFYSHRRHVAVADLQCQTCHGGISSSEVPPTRVRQLTMEACMDCHQENGVTNDCTTCHR
jgi:hypothetical protein